MPRPRLRWEPGRRPADGLAAEKEEKQQQRKEPADPEMSPVSSGQGRMAGLERDRCTVRHLDTVQEQHGTDERTAEGAKAVGVFDRG